MRKPDRDIVERMRWAFPTGSRVRLLVMDDVCAPPVGTMGTVEHVDDIGTIFVKWDNGSSLGVAYGKDACCIAQEDAESDGIDPVKTYCFGETQEWQSRKRAESFFIGAMLASEGRDQRRCLIIYTKLVLGFTFCDDEEGRTDECETMQQGES